MNVFVMSICYKEIKPVKISNFYHKTCTAKNICRNILSLDSKDIVKQFLARYYFKVTFFNAILSNIFFLYSFTIK